MKITVKPNTYIFLVTLILLVPYQWLMAWFAAAAIHEFGHWLAVIICRGNVLQVTVGVGGASIQTEPMTEWKRLVCILSGPVVGLFPALLGNFVPRIAIFSWLLSMYNLLPLTPLDGGRALQVLLGETSYFRAVEYILMSLLLLGALYAGFVLHIGFLPLALVGIISQRRRKSPCKQNACKVE